MFNFKSNLINEIHCKIVDALQPYSEITKAGGKCYCSILQQAEHLGPIWESFKRLCLHCKNTVATLFNGAAPLSPFLLSHWHTVLLMEAAELGLGGSVGSALQWRSRSRQDPSKQGLSLLSSYKGCSTHVQTREGWKEREAIKSAKYFNNIRILRRQISWI